MQVNQWKRQKHKNYPVVLHWVQCQKHLVNMDGVHISQEQHEVMNGPSYLSNYYRFCVINRKKYGIHSKYIVTIIISN